MPKYKRVILVAIGDKQAGHEGALVNPDTEFPVWDVGKDGKYVVAEIEKASLSPMQKRLWIWHEDDRQMLSNLADKDSIIYLGMGDETQGGIYKDNLKEVSLSRQHLISYYNMLPWLGMSQVTAAYFGQGTSVHLWGAGDTETILIHRLKAEYPKKRIALMPHWELDINGYIVDAAHHGPGSGIREWTKGNILRLYTKSIMQKLQMNGKRVPNLLLRAHYHQPIKETVTLNLDTEILETEAWITPPLCIIGSHGQKVTQSVSQMHVGFLAFEIIDGQLYKTHKFIHTFDTRAQERVKI